jgi:hypothetical protein
LRVCACTVRFRDRRGVEHSTDVRASSVYEAACRAWAIFKGSEQTEEESYKTEEFVVEVHEEPKTYRVNLEKMLEWLNRGRRGSKDTQRKQELRKLKDANLWGPLPDATISRSHGSRR